MVAVIAKDGTKLMPTKRHGKVRHLLSQRKAVIVGYKPILTIQLTYDTPNHTQDITLGIDAGTNHIGLSATTETQEVYAEQIETRGNEIVRNLSSRRESRRTRRGRKTRYRKPRFSNRTSSKQPGWVPPSIREKVGTHVRAIERVTDIMPVTRIVIETAQFDIQRLKAMEEGKPLPVGEDYQHGEMEGWNAREYALYRDRHTCQCCHGTTGDTVLQVHHIESRKTGGNAPNNLVTLCKTCHDAYHEGKLELPAGIASRGKSYRDVTAMSIMRPRVLSVVRERYAGSGVEVVETFGYVTKNARVRCGLEKSHVTDARCISGHPLASPCEEVVFSYRKRCHNRQLFKANTLKGGKRRRNQGPREVRGFRLWDSVVFEGRRCVVSGKRSSGYFAVRSLDGSFKCASVSYKRFSLLCHNGSWVSEVRRSEEI